MAPTLALSAGVLLKAGANYSNTLNSGTQGKTGKDIIDGWIEEAEGYLSTALRQDLVSGYSGYNASTKLILQKATETIAAIEVIRFDMNGYTSRVEAESMVNILFEELNKMLAVLIDQKGAQYVVGST